MATNRTNVRSPVPAWVLPMAGAASSLAPGFAARRLSRWFTQTRRRPFSEAEAAFRAAGRRHDFHFAGRALVARSFGEGPTVLLQHGWNGSGADFRHLVPRLVAAGYRAVALDAPGHGESGGDRSTVGHFARALAAVGPSFGPLQGVVAHSLGGPAAAWALAARHLVAPRLVLLAPEPDPAAWLRGVGRLLSEPMAPALVRELHRRAQVPPDELALARCAPWIEAETLLLHDPQDEDTAFGPVAAVASGWERATLIPVPGQGHRRLLRDPATLDAVTRFVSGRVPERCGHGALASACESCALERSLFEIGSER